MSHVADGMHWGVHGVPYHAKSTLSSAHKCSREERERDRARSAGPREPHTHRRGATGYATKMTNDTKRDDEWQVARDIRTSHRGTHYGGRGGGPGATAARETGDGGGAPER